MLEVLNLKLERNLVVLMRYRRYAIRNMQKVLSETSISLRVKQRLLLIYYQYYAAPLLGRALSVLEGLP